MKIEHYSFGSITINGKTCTSDVIIYPNKVNSSWWRKQGHMLHVEDLTDIIQTKPDVLVVGTGYSGLMIVPKETVLRLESEGIEIHIARTTKAVELFNTLRKEKRVVAALHLTC
jgi:hypothetical protein